MKFRKQEVDDMKKGKKIVFLILNVLVPILLGTIIYYLISPEVMFVQQIDKIFGYRVHINGINLNNVIIQFVRNYLLDMMWGYALVFALFFIIVNNTAELMKIFIIAFAFSAIMEFLQLTSFVRGTFDIFDIIVEFLAEVTAVFIIKKHFLGGTKEI